MARVRRLTNSATRASESFTQPRRRAFRTVPVSLPKLGIRRLMKRDPVDGLSQPSYDRVTDTKGVAGLSGASKGVSVSGHTESKQTGFGSGQKVIRTDGVNRSLKSR